jgi:hypothetical protein
VIKLYLTADPVEAVKINGNRYRQDLAVVVKDPKEEPLASIVTLLNEVVDVLERHHL